MPLSRVTFPVGALGCNCTIVSCPETREALVIDPGDEAEEILATLARGGLTAVKLVHTHAHFDHVMATGEVAARTGAPVLLHRDDRWLYDHAVMQTEAFGIRRPDGAPWRPPPPPTHELAGDESLAFGRREARALHTPGHTPGSICLYLEHAAETPILFAGDTLFQGSIGRTDLWGGSMAAIRQSIRDRLLTLPDDTLVVPGHGPETTVLREREENPFVGRFADRFGDGDE
jgi:glyoxylase-like metal-dependent hydrolase (beta-lactamase superfamily II)